MSSVGSRATHTHGGRTHMQPRPGELAGYGSCSAWIRYQGHPHSAVLVAFVAVAAEGLGGATLNVMDPDLMRPSHSNVRHTGIWA